MYVLLLISKNTKQVKKIIEAKYMKNYIYSEHRGDNYVDFQVFLLIIFIYITLLQDNKREHWLLQA